MKNRRLWIISFTILALSCLAVLWPLLRPGFYVSDDGEWMIIRLSAFYQSLAEGQFPVRFLGRLNYSYGYPVANFLYPGFLYAGALIHFLGVPFVLTVKILLFLSVVGAAVTIFFTVRKKFSLGASMVGVLGFLFSPYLSFDLYKRGSVGEIVALLPASLILYAIQSGIYWLLTPTVAFLILSHNTVAIMLLPIFLAFTMLQKKIVKSAPYWICGIGLAAFFWMPALIEKRFVIFDSITVSNPEKYFIVLGNAGLLGFATVISLIMAFGISKKNRDIQPLLIATIIGYIFALPLSIFFWRTSSLASLVQFPYRFLIIPVLCGPWAFAAVFDQLKGAKQMLFVSVCIVLWLHTLVLSQGAIQFVNRPEGFYTTNEATTTVLDEYMPIWVQRKPTTHNPSVIEVLQGDAQATEIKATTQTIELMIQARSDSMIQINRTFYPGWGVTIDGEIAQINPINTLGLVQVRIPSGDHRVLAQFRETKFRFTTDVISFISVIVFVILILSKRFRYA